MAARRPLTAPAPCTLETSSLKLRPALFFYGFMGSSLIVVGVSSEAARVGLLFGPMFLGAAGYLIWRIRSPWRLELTAEGFALARGDWVKTRRHWADLLSLRLKRFHREDYRVPLSVWFGRAFVIEYVVRSTRRPDGFGAAPAASHLLPGSWELQPDELLKLMCAFHEAYANPADR